MVLGLLQVGLKLVLFAFCGLRNRPKKYSPLLFSLSSLTRIFHTDSAAACDEPI